MTTMTSPETDAQIQVTASRIDEVIRRQRRALAANLVTGVTLLGGWLTCVVAFLSL